MESKISKYKCIKCGTKESIFFKKVFLKNEVEISIEPCNKCGFKADFSYIINLK